MKCVIQSPMRPPTFQATASQTWYHTTISLAPSDNDFT